MQRSDRASTQLRALDQDVFDLLVNTIKGLAMDGVEAAKSGHPGMPMGMAIPASLLWTRFLVHDPSDPSWADRDRFVLSAGHGSMLLYALLHLTGYDLSLDELRRFRQWGSKTPGHPEYRHTPGVEVTTGPLGTGFAAGVGMALAERFLAARYNRPGHTVIDHFTYGIVSDGDLMEGIAAEAASLAGHLGLGKLVYLYDDNRITIDGSTDLSFTENVDGRFHAYGWHVQRVDGRDVEAIARAIEAARAESDRPSLIACRTIIADGAPTKAGSEQAHGAPLGLEEVQATKRAMGWPLEPFHVPRPVSDAMQASLETLAVRRREWNARFAAYTRDHGELAAELEGVLSGGLPPGSFDDLPSFSPGTAIATRKASHKVLQALVQRHPTLIGGSADLAGSNGVDVKDIGTHGRDNPSGRVIHFGVREHGMAGVCNGMALHGGVRPFAATFLVFSDFMRGALRLAALMRAPVVFVFSHDSIHLGEDGPTHQPIEHLMSLRLIPNLWVVRPADATETIGAWKLALSRGLLDGPTAILLTRQDLPVLTESRQDVSCGAYVLWQPEGAAVSDLHGILLATGSEVSLALAAARRLHEHHGRSVRVVSMPCWEAFEAQPVGYRESVLPQAIERRLSVEAGVPTGWGRWARHHLAIEQFGASAPANVLAEKLGFTVEALVMRYLELP